MFPVMLSNWILAKLSIVIIVVFISRTSNFGIRQTPGLWTHATPGKCLWVRFFRKSDKVSLTHLDINTQCRLPCASQHPLHTSTAFPLVSRHSGPEHCAPAHHRPVQYTHSSTTVATSGRQVSCFHNTFTLTNIRTARFLDICGSSQPSNLWYSYYYGSSANFSFLEKYKSF